MFIIVWRGKFYVGQGKWTTDQASATQYDTTQEAFAVADRYVSASVYPAGEEL